MARRPSNDQEMGWLWIHGTSAGCMSIGLWEALRTLLAGPALVVVYCGATFLGLHAVRLHHRRVTRAHRRR